MNIGFNLPQDMITQTFAILAKRRTGKTYTASVMAEEMVKAELPFVVLDPTGAWWGLRASADGKREGLPVIVIGGAHGDLPLEAHSGRLIAEIVVEHPGWYVIDLSLSQSNAEQDRFALDFAERIYRLKEKHREPLHLFVDEADSFAPQRPIRGQERMLGAYESLVRRGGIRGVGVTLITQRPAVLNKNVLTQTEVLIVLQITAPQDQKAIDDWVRQNGTKEERDTLMASLASLKQGEAWVWSPSWLEKFERVRIRQRETFNSSATPKAGERAVVPQRFAAVDLEKLRARILGTTQRVQQEDPQTLREEIAALRRQLNARPTEVREVIKEVFPDALRSSLSAALEDVHTSLEGVGTSLSHVEALLQPVEAIQPADHKTVKGLRRGGWQILATLSAYNSLTPAQLATLSYMAKSGTFQTYLSQLRQFGFIESNGRGLAITERGLFHYTENREPLLPPPATTQEIVAAWSVKLRSGARRMLAALIPHYPRGISRGTLASEAGLQKSGTFQTYLSTLKRLGLAETGINTVKASPTLFLNRGGNHE